MLNPIRPSCSERVRPFIKMDIIPHFVYGIMKFSTSCSTFMVNGVCA